MSSINFALQNYKYFSIYARIPAFIFFLHKKRVPKHSFLDLYRLFSLIVRLRFLSAQNFATTGFFSD